MGKIIGITGGVGCGKSTVMKLLAENYHCLTISTDDVAREQMLPGGIAYERVVKEFGEGILLENGNIDRGKPAGIVFSDPAALSRLNALTHPAVTEYVLAQVERERKENRYEFLIIESALLIEGGYQAFCDEVWYIYTSEKERRERLKRDRGYTDEKISDLMARQHTAEDFFAVASHVIENGDGCDRKALLARIEEITGVQVQKQKKQNL